MNMRLGGFIGRRGRFTEFCQQQIFRLIDGTIRVGHTLILQFHVLIAEHGKEIADSVNTGFLLSQHLRADHIFIRCRVCFCLRCLRLGNNRVTLGSVARRGDHVANAFWHFFKFLNTF